MKFVMVFLFVVFSAAAFAQQDTAIKFSKYLGTFYIGSYDSKGTRTDDVTLRLGGAAVLPVIERITLNTWAGYETGPTTKGYAFGKFYFERKSSVINIGLGYMPRPIAFIMRPAPLSADGHFEPPALSAIPGMKTGAFIGRKFWNNGPDVVIAVFSSAPSKSAEFNASLVQKFGLFDVSVAGFASRERSGIAGRINVKKVSLTAFTTNDSVSTGLLCWEMKFFTFYLNANYNRSNDSFTHLEAGIVKTFAMPYNGMKMLVGAGYLQHSKSMNVYAQLYFD